MGGRGLPAATNICLQVSWPQIFVYKCPGGYTTGCKCCIELVDRFDWYMDGKKDNTIKTRGKKLKDCVFLNIYMRSPVRSGRGSGGCSPVVILFCWTSFVYG
jgi:hypothetical protein